MRKSNGFSVMAATVCVLGMTACQGGWGIAVPEKNRLLSDEGLRLVNEFQAPPSPTPCASSDESEYGDPICIGLAYVAYRDRTGRSVLTEDEAASAISGANEIWNQCGIAFQLETFQEVDPAMHTLPFAGALAERASYSARRSFDSLADDRFVVIATGAWGTTKDAWTAPPGAPPYGIVADAEVAAHVGILAHELGHYLALDHEYDRPSNLLNEMTYAQSNRLSDAQCKIARDSAIRDWPQMLR